MTKSKEKPKAEVAQRGQSSLVLSKDNLKSLLDTPEFKENLALVASKYLTPERIVKISLLAVSRQPKLFNCTKVSVIRSIIKAAELGLDFAGQTGQGYLVPFGTECQFIPGYQGFIEIAYRSKQITYIDAQLVHDNDDFDYGLGSNPFVKHKPCLGTDAERGRVLCGYAVARLIGSDIPKIEIMTYDDIIAIKKRSKAKDKGPWVTDESEMMRKTVVRRIFKYIPKTPEITQALEVDNAQFDFSINTTTPEEAPPGVAGLKDRMKKPAVAKVKEATFEEPTTDAQKPDDVQKAEEKTETNAKALDQAFLKEITTELEKCQQRLMAVARDESLSEAVDFANFSASHLGGQPADYWMFDEEMQHALKVDAYSLETIATLNKAIDASGAEKTAKEEPESKPGKFQCSKCHKIYTKDIKKCTCLGDVVPVTE